jgi:hypothetical protein
MITELGHFALILALCVAVVQSVVPLVGAARGNLTWMAVGRNAALAQFALVALAMLSLMHAYVTNDFSVINVVENSHTDKPLLYQITGVWGNHEGSMVLWVFMLGLCSAAMALFSSNLPPDLRARVLAVQGMIATASSSRMKAPRSGSVAKAWTDVSTPDRTRNVPTSDREKVMIASRMVQLFIVLRFSTTIEEWISAVPTSHGMKLAFSTGSQNHQPPQPNV